MAASSGKRAIPKWASLAPAGVQLGEFVSVSYDPLTGHIIGGLWDNGIAIKTSPSANSWNEILLTDGGLVQATSSNVGGIASPIYYYNASVADPSKVPLLATTNRWNDLDGDGVIDPGEHKDITINDTRNNALSTGTLLISNSDSSLNTWAIQGRPKRMR